MPQPRTGHKAGSCYLLLSVLESPRAEALGVLVVHAAAVLAEDAFGLSLLVLTLWSVELVMMCLWFM